MQPSVMHIWIIIEAGFCIKMPNTNSTTPLCEYRAVHHDPRTQYRSNRKEYRTDRIERLPKFLRKNAKKINMPLFGELSQASLDSFESESDSNKSWEDRLNSPKSGKNKYYTIFWRVKPIVPRICSNRNPIPKNPIPKNTGTFGLIAQKLAFSFLLHFFNRIKLN